MLGFAILLGFYALGSLIQSVFHLPLPGNVIGMALFTASLFLNLVKVEWVEASCAFLIRHMLLLFAPLVVGTMLFFVVIGGQAAAILLSLVVSTVGAMLVTGWTVKLMARVSGRKEERPHDLV